MSKEHRPRLISTVTLFSNVRNARKILNFSKFYQSNNFRMHIKAFIMLYDVLPFNQLSRKTKLKGYGKKRNARGRGKNATMESLYI